MSQSKAHARPFQTTKLADGMSDFERVVGVIATGVTLCGSYN